MRVAARACRALALAAGTGLASIGLVGAATPAHAAACSGTNGVTVVVQSSAGTSTRCAAGDPSSAMAALRASGHSVDMPSQFPGAICRIDGYPTSDPCVRMPPGDAYWAFFHAPSGGSWTYSQSGAGSHDPRPGSSVGFRFGSGSAPSVRPAAPAPAPQPTRTTAAPKPTTAASKPTSTARRTAEATPRTTAGTSTTSPRSTAAKGPSTGVRGGTAATTAPSETSRAATSSASATSSTSPSPSAARSASALPSPSGSATTTPAQTDLAAGREQDTGTSGSSSLVGGGVLLAGLAAAVGVVAVRRRSTE